MWKLTYIHTSDELSNRLYGVNINTQVPCIYKIATNYCAISYYINGRLHKIDGPCTSYYENKVLVEEVYCIYGKLHRTRNKPASVLYDLDGHIDFMEWYLNNQTQRAIKP